MHDLWGGLIKLLKFLLVLLVNSIIYIENIRNFHSSSSMRYSSWQVDDSGRPGGVDLPAL